MGHKKLAGAEAQTATDKPYRRVKTRDKRPVVIRKIGEHGRDRIMTDRPADDDQSEDDHDQKKREMDRQEHDTRRERSHPHITGGQTPFLVGKMPADLLTRQAGQGSDDQDEADRAFVQTIFPRQKYSIPFMDAVVKKAHREDKKEHITDVRLGKRLEVIDTSIVPPVDQRVIEKYPAQGRDRAQYGGNKKKPAPMDRTHKDHPADRSEKTASEIRPDQSAADIFLEKIADHHQAQRRGARRRDAAHDLRQKNRCQRLAHPGDQTENGKNHHGRGKDRAVGKKTRERRVQKRAQTVRDHIIGNDSGDDKIRGLEVGGNERDRGGNGSRIK